MNNPCFTVCGIVAIQGKILLVRHTYGIAKGRILLPGGCVREGELPDRAVEREDITNLSREILTAYLHDSPRLERSDYLPAAAKRENYALFGA